MKKYKRRKVPSKNRFKNVHTIKTRRYIGNNEPAPGRKEYRVYFTKPGVDNRVDCVSRNLYNQYAKEYFRVCLGSDWQHPKGYLKIFAFRGKRSRAPSSAHLIIRHLFAVSSKAIFHSLWFIGIIMCVCVRVRVVVYPWTMIEREFCFLACCCALIHSWK